MDAKRLVTVLLLAHTKALLTVNRDYHLIKMKKTWSEAQSYCREKFVDLATIETPEENARMRQVHRPFLSESPYAWIGLYNEVKSWRWSLDNTSFNVSALEDQFVFYRDNYQRREHCAVVVGGELQDRDCEAGLDSICYDEPSQAYIPVADAMSWVSAQRYCRQTYTDLASVRNQQEMENFLNVTDSSWVGLSREAWKWSDQSDSPFRGWRPDQPNGPDQNCVVNEALGWNDIACGQTHYFICSGTPNKKVIKITLQSDGNLDLNDPLIQEGILKHMEQQMKNVGIHRHLQLSWRKQPNGTVFN